MLNVGLTGNIASGKSTVARLFADWGAAVIDADAIVHELEQPGTPVFQAIVAKFGEEVLAPDGLLDRGALRARVFGNRDALAALNGIVHPAVAAERDRRMAEARAARVRVLIQDIPLLFEVMDPKQFDAVVLVDAPVAARRERLERLRGLDPDMAESMIGAQRPSAEKRSRATFIIDNEADFATLEKRTREVWRQLERRAARSP
jgi:dephospho-CoA kinase